MKESIDKLVNIETLIAEVEKYPEIWNTRSDAYADRSRRKSAWMKVSQAFFVGFEEKGSEEKDEICNCLSKKWRNVKDTFLKTVKKSRAGSRCRKYLYAKHLNFLKQAYFHPDYEFNSNPDQPESTESSCDEGSGISTYPPEFLEDQDDGTASSPPANKNTKRKRKLSSEYNSQEPWIKLEQPVSSMEQSSSSSTSLSVVSANQAFFNSLLPIVDGFTDMEIVDFRLDVLSTVKRMQYARRSQSDKQ